jgi:RimJ/RimL family protein N-acetyltransferase
MTAIPTLETDRLILRQFLPSDLDALQAMMSEPAAVEYTSGSPLSREEAWKDLVRHRGMWAISGFGYLAVEEKATRQFVGGCGVQERMRDIEPSLVGTLEAGWTFSTGAQGKGYAREAMRAVIAWCTKTHPQMAISCIIDERNERSIRLAVALGFEEFARTVYGDKPTIVFQHQAAQVAKH